MLGIKDKSIHRIVVTSKTTSKGQECFQGIIVKSIQGIVVKIGDLAKQCDLVVVDQSPHQRHDHSRVARMDVCMEETVSTHESS